MNTGEAALLSVIIPFGGGTGRLNCTLRSLSAAVSGLSSIEMEFVVVIDGIDLDLESYDAAFLREIRMVTIARSGRSAARNAGAAVARGSRLLFLDSDVLLEKAALKLHAELTWNQATYICRGTIGYLPWLAALEDPLSGKLTARAAKALNITAESTPLISRHALSEELVCHPEMLRSICRRIPFEQDLALWFSQHGSDDSNNWIGCTGGQLSLPTSTFRRLGGFDEQMGVRWGAEDLEFGYRAVKAGIGIRHAADARCYHMDHAVEGRANDHVSALEYFALKHDNRGVLKLRDYFASACTLAEVMEACHVAS